jgi:tetratricopeptide (TPR) repeat protein
MPVSLLRVNDAAPDQDTKILMVKFRILLFAFIALASHALRAQYDRGFFLAAVEFSTDKMEIDGPSVESYKIRGWAFHNLDSLERALNDYSQAITMGHGDHDLFFRRGDVLFDLGQFKLSIADYNKAIQLAPDSLTYYVSRGVAFEAAHDYSKALTDYNYVLLKQSNHEYALFNRAILYYKRLNEIDNGLNDLQKLLKSFPTAEYYNERGKILMTLARYDAAFDDFNSAVNLDSTIGEHYSNRGNCLANLNHGVDAADDFSESQRLDARNPYLYKYRGEFKYRNGDRQSACLDFFEAEQLGLKIDNKKFKCETK